MRISDWSSDVCSSDLPPLDTPLHQEGAEQPDPDGEHRKGHQVELLERTDRVARRQVEDVDQSHRDERQRELQDEQIGDVAVGRSEEHTSELQSLMRISYAVFCLKKKHKEQITTITHIHT